MPLMNIDAIIFDLDGVLTDSAKVHAIAWKTMFDDFLNKRSAKNKETFRPFNAKDDYALYVDGKPRYEGVSSFLLSRGIRLSYGDPADAPDQETVCGLGNLKDRMFTSILDQKGIEVFDSSVRLIHELRAVGVHCGVASSSKNCQKVLQIAGIENLFEARVDGVVSAELGLKGKPAPDIFLKCAELLKISPDRSVVVEDAISGVQAGRDGCFGLVIGVDRVGLGEELAKNGADVVVTDLSDVSPDNMDEWCRTTRRASSNGQQNAEH